MQPPLLATKYRLPPARPRLIGRPRLLRRLVEGLRRPVSVLSAPAGFGKSTLLLDAARAHAGRAWGWLALDSDDNDPGRFLAYLLAALDAALPGLADNASALLTSPQPPAPAAILTVLINDLESRAAPAVLVLDDYHLITAPAVHELVIFLADHLPPVLRLALTARADPPLPLARWRARDQLTELRADDLRFSPEEAADFLDQAMGLDLTPAQAAALEARTEGWAAGLQLAALSMRGRPDADAFIRAFAASPRVVVDYLAEEVLSREPREVQDFLLATSVLERLCAPLCDALTGRPDGAAQIERLRQRNLFVIALDDEGRWYRYHQLFSDVLRARQALAPDADPAGLHRRAAAWFEAEGWIDEAIAHALKGSDLERAARLIAAGRDRLAGSGQAATLAAWLAALPSDLTHSRPDLALAGAWASGALGDYASAANWLSTAEGALAGRADPEAAALRVEAASARAMASSFLEEPAALALSEAALSELPPEAGLLRLIVTIGLVFACFRAGRLAEAERMLRPMVAAADRREPVNAAGVIAMLAMVARLQGRLTEAGRLSADAATLATVNGRLLVDASAALALAVRGRVAYERGNLAAAEADWRDCAAVAETAGALSTQIYALTNLVDLAALRKDATSARDWAARAASAAHGRPLTPSTRRTLEAGLAMADIIEGRPEAAEAWAHEQAGLSGGPGLSPYDLQRPILAEALLAQGRWAEALDTLDTLAAEAQSGGLGDFQARAAVRSVAALLGAGRGAEARARLGRALALSAPEGHLSVWLEGGEPVFVLLAVYAAGAGADDNLRRFARQVLTAAGRAPSPTEGLVESLSSRELEVLRLAAAGLADREIAEKLVVAVGTVKKHLSNIYGKLGVKSRTQAIAEARTMGLL